MDNESSYHIPPNLEEDPARTPGLGRKVWFGLLCTGTAFLSFALATHLDSQRIYDLMTPLDAPPQDKAATTVYIFAILLISQSVLEWQYLHMPSRARHHRTIMGIVLLGVCLLVMGHFFLLALTSV